LEFWTFTFLNIPKAVVKFVRRAEISWEMLPLATCVGLELGRVALAVPNRNGFSLWISTGTGG